MHWLLLMFVTQGIGRERPDIASQVFQFQRIDGDADDWPIVPDSYAIGTNQLRETVMVLGDKHDPPDLDVNVKAGWSKGLNQIYFLNEASDDYSDFARKDPHNDLFEIVIDGDLSGGPSRFSRQFEFGTLTLRHHYGCGDAGADECVGVFSRKTPTRLSIANYVLESID